MFCSYAKIHIPIIASVSEHQPTTWVSFFFDLHILICTFPAGLWLVVKKINDERVFGKNSNFFHNLTAFLCLLIKKNSLFREKNYVVTNKITGRIRPNFNHSFLECGDFLS